MAQMETLHLPVMVQVTLSAAVMLKQQQTRILLNVELVFIQQQTGIWFSVINNFIGVDQWQ